jgi:hypothetical protein
VASHHRHFRFHRWLAASLAVSLPLGIVPLQAQERYPAGAPPAPAASRLMELDPVGSILERRDSLRLADSQVTRLVQLNLRLFRRNRQLQLRIDSLLPDWAGPDLFGPAPSERDTPASSTPDSVMARVRPLMEQMRANSRAARDTALALLTEEQRERLGRMEDQVMRRGARPRPGGPRP